MAISRQESKYKISVVMPIYNVEPYLEEAIESVIGQTIGFEENIQMILVNDGSPDNCDRIAKKYQERYPENIVYIEKENGGVSSARNVGMEYIRGKYVNFFDSDDKWTPDAFEKAYQFLEEHADEIDMVSARTVNFGRNETKHYLDYRYTEDRIVDIDQEYDALQMAVNSVFIREGSLKGRSFDTRLQVSEDSVFFAKILLEKGKYGLLKSATYYYRWRETQNSVIDKKRLNKSWYLETLQHAYYELFRYSIEKFGEVIPYIQNHVMNDCRERMFKIADEAPLSQEEVKAYTNLLAGLLQEIDDAIIINQRCFGYAWRVFALALKYDTTVSEIMKQTTLDRWWVIYKNIRLINLRANKRLHITHLSVANNRLCLMGSTQLGIMGSDYYLFLRDSNNREYDLELFPMPDNDIYVVTGEKILEGNGFRIEVPLENIEWVEIRLKGKTDVDVLLSPSFGEETGLDKNQQYRYRMIDKYIIKYVKNRIRIMPKTLKKMVGAQYRYLKGKWKNVD